MRGTKAKAIRDQYRLLYRRDPLAPENRGDYRKFKKRHIKNI